MKQPALNFTLCSLLETAIADARRLDRTQYKPRYGDWHNPNSQGVCEVCLAGSYLAGSLGCSSKSRLAPWDFSSSTQRTLETLNAMRCGAWHEAYRLLYQRNATYDIEIRLIRLPVPFKAHFVGWQEFDAHLHSLESIIPKLRSIESADRHIEALKG